MLNQIRFAWLIAALLFALTSLARGAVEDRIEKIFTVPGNGKLIMDVDRGSIEVSTSDGNSLKVEVLRKVEKGNRAQGEEAIRQHHVEFKQDGDTVEIHSEFAGGGLQRRAVNLQIRYLVTAPRKLNVELKTKGGSISVRDLEGKADVRTSGGHLDLAQITGSVFGQTLGGHVSVNGCQDQIKVETSGGDIRIGDAGGSVTAKTSGGSIKVGKARGDVTVHTSGGHIDLAGVSGKIEASTTGGSVRASLGQQPAKDCVLKTTGGNIQVTLPASAAVDLDAKSNGGSVTTDFDVATPDKSNRSSLQAKLNGGGPALVAHTTAGRVEIRKQ